MNLAEEILVKWYLGELGGYALFMQLGSGSPPEAAAKWLALSRVEQAVASGVAAALLKRKVRVPVPENLEARARSRCAKVVGKSWIETMQWFRTVAADALRRMKADANRLPADLATVGELVVRHEEALLAFADLELAGRASEALIPIEKFLGIAN
jgi:hypothetical protein